jgi:hypothetical protein
VAFYAWWVFNFPIFLSGCLLSDVTIEVGIVMLARVLCESVSTHLICSRGKLTIREVVINVFFANKFRHFLTKNWEIFTECCFFHVPQLFPITSVNLTNVVNFWEIANFAISQNWGEPWW